MRVSHGVRSFWHLAWLVGAIFGFGPISTDAQNADAPAAQAAPSCKPDGEVGFVCGQRRPEDLVQIPGTDWVMASWLGGGVVAIDARDRTTTVLYPSPAALERIDTARYAGCPGVPDDKQKAVYLTAGIALRPGKDGVHTFYATHFGWQRGVDVFELDARGTVPSLTLVGCVMLPDGVGVDGIVPLSDGGFIITNWVKPGPDFASNLARMKTGEVNGELWEWHPGKGWSKVPGSETSGANGIELSKDGRTLFVNAWGGQYFFRLTLGARVPKRDVVRLGFRPDNIRWAPDGQLLVGGQTVTEDGTRVVKIDPLTLKVTDLISLHNTSLFAAGTGALQVGNEYWIGSAVSDRIAVIPVATHIGAVPVSNARVIVADSAFVSLSRTILSTAR